MRPHTRTPAAPGLFRLGDRATPIVAAIAALALVVGLAGCTSRPALLAEPPPVPTEDATFDTAPIEAAMDAMLTAGAPAVLIEVRDGDAVWRHALGVTAVTGDARPDPLAPVRVASVTKSMVGTLLMQLVAEGEVDLDEPIATYLPELRLGRVVLEAGSDVANGTNDSGAGTEGEELELEPSPVPTGPGWTAPGSTPSPTDVPAGAVVGSDVAFDAAGTPIIDPTSLITPRMLAQHTAGLPDYITTFPLADFAELPTTLESEYELPDLIGRVAAEPWSGAPGAAFQYSNTNYLVLSLLIERLTGETIDAALQQRIFDAGKLAATELPTTPDLPEGGAHGYFTHDGVYVDVSRQSGSLWSGAGGVVSTTGDVNSFYRALMQGVYLAPDELHTALTLNDSGYGIGVQGHLDPCPAGEPVFATSPPGAAGASPRPSEPVYATPNPDAAGGPGTAPATTATSIPDAPGGVGGQAPATTGAPFPTLEQLVRIGEPGMTYGHIGSGLGYRILSFSSPDGMRQVSIAWTASPIDYSSDPRLEPAWQAVDAALAATCRTAGG